VSAYSASGQYLDCIEAAVLKQCSPEVAKWQRRLTADMFLAVGFDHRCAPLVYDSDDQP